jgi:Tfp pilus assembly protein FimT
MIKFKGQTRGFTIMELLVSIGVFLSLFLMVTVNFRAGESINELRLETQKIASDIRKLQTLALTGSTYNYNGITTPIGIGGYGIKFTNDTTTYEIYSDTSAVYGILDDSDVAPLESITLSSNFLPIVVVNQDISIAHLTFLPHSSAITLKTLNGEEVEDMSAETLVIEIYHNKVINKKGVIEITPVSGRVNFYLDEAN